MARNLHLEDKYLCHRLCMDGNVVELSLLLREKNEIEIHLQDENFGWNPLHWSAYFGKLECLELLLTQTTNLVNEQTRFSQTPLHLAAFAGQSKCVEYLISRGADVNKQDHLSENALHKAARTGNLECLSVLVNNGANLELVNKQGLSAELICYFCGHLQAFDFFLHIRPRRSENGYSQLKSGVCDVSWILSGLNGGHLPPHPFLDDHLKQHLSGMNGMTTNGITNGHSNCEMEVETNLFLNGTRNGINSIPNMNFPMAGRKRSNDEMNDSFIKRMKCIEDAEVNDVQNVELTTSSGDDILPRVPHHQSVYGIYDINRHLSRCMMGCYI